MMRARTSDDRELGGDERAAIVAFSNLYLDTELDDADHRALARTLAVTSLSLDALDRLLREDVHPALWMNLASVAGVWTAFDEAWLLARVRARRRARVRWPTTLVPLYALVDAEWRRVRAQVVTERSSPNGR